MNVPAWTGIKVGHVKVIWCVPCIINLVCHRILLFFFLIHFFVVSPLYLLRNQGHHSMWMASIVCDSRIISYFFFSCSSVWSRIFFFFFFPNWYCRISLFTLLINPRNVFVELLSHLLLRYSFLYFSMYTGSLNAYIAIFSTSREVWGRRRLSLHGDLIFKSGHCSDFFFCSIILNEFF